MPIMIDIDPDKVREDITESGLSMRTISRKLGYTPAYLSIMLARGRMRKNVYDEIYKIINPGESETLAELKEIKAILSRMEQKAGVAK